MVYDITLLYNIFQKKRMTVEDFQQIVSKRKYLAILRELQSKLVFDCKLKLIIDNTTSHCSLRSELR